jgi:hypothetical protein
MWGKEHYLEVNGKIGCYFTDQPAETEIYSNDLRKSVSLKFSEPVAWRMAYMSSHVLITAGPCRYFLDALLSKPAAQKPTVLRSW